MADDLFTPETGFISLHDLAPKYWTLSSPAGEIVTISMEDGSFKFGPGHKKHSEAAEVFLSAICGEYREYLEWKKSKRAEHDK